MIISLALLGYGVSGTFLTLIKHHISAHFNVLYILNAILFSIATIGCFSIAQHTPFNGLELIWNPRQIGWLILIYLLLALPFFFAANCFGLAFVQFQKHIHRIYHWDLIGAGLGALIIIALLFLFKPEICLRLIAILGLIAALLPTLDKAKRGLWLIRRPALIAAAILVLIWPSDWLKPNISEFKGLVTTLQIIGTELVQESFSPLGLLSVVQSHRIPFRHAPGLSLTTQTEPPPQIAIFTDADGMTAITRFDGRIENLSYLDDQTSAAAYHLLTNPNVLIIGAGGGSDVLQALYHRVSSIDALELNPQMVELVRDDFGDYAGNIYRHPNVKIHIGDARGYLAASKRSHDLIQVSLVDSFASSGAGTHALSEGYLYTVEALQEYYDHLDDQGLIAITRWLKLPPRDSLKLFATAIEALNRTGVSQPGRQLALIRSWQTSTLLIKKGVFTQVEIERLRNFSEQRSFDIAYIPGISRREANRYNILDQPYLFEGSTALLSDESKAYIEDYKFNLQPATDDRPYYFHFFKWRLLPELIALRDQGSLVLLDSGYLILTATLTQAIPISIVLILIPLLALRKGRVSSAKHWPAGLYFLFLGLAFLFVEIAFIQRLILFVSHPLYSAALVLSGFLVFAGLGSGYSARLEQWARPFNRSAIDLAVLGIVALSLIHLLVLPPLLSEAMAYSMPIKSLIAIVSIAPLAFCMGMPFPLGLTRLARQSPEFIPWAWGINGCASVLSALLATLIAIHFGFQIVIVLAIVLYGFATVIWR